MKVILIILLILILIFLIGEYYIYLRIFKNNRKKPLPEGHFGDGEFDQKIKEMTEALDEIPCERIRATAYDGLRLCARYYEGTDPVNVDICFHGYKGSATRDYCAIGKYLIDKGHQVILVHERAHSKSEGRTICYGIKERYDVLTWVNYAIRRFGENIRINIYGISMGGGTVLMASGLDLPDNVTAILADCPYSSAQDVINNTAHDMGLPDKALSPFIYLAGLIYGSVNIKKTTAAEEVKKTKVPILIIHGDADTLVPPYMSEEVEKANPDMVERHLIKGADHGISYMVDKKRYLEIVEAFLARVNAQEKAE